jgi:hypothetical protein
MTLIDKFLLESGTNAIQHLKLEVAETLRCQPPGEIDKSKVVGCHGRADFLRAHEEFELGGVGAVDGTSER